MSKNLKQEFITRLIYLDVPKKYHEGLWNFITSNFISNEEVEGLKMKEEIGGTYIRDGYNFAVRKINQKINNLLKK